MISRDARESIEWLFDKAIREHSVNAASDRCEIHPHAGRDEAGSGSSADLVVLNISSYLFRIVALFEFERDGGMRSHLAGLAGLDERTLDENVLFDAYAEFVNMVCGAVNRGLSARFHAGMSTPFFLESACVDHVAILQPTEIVALTATINDTARFRLTLCVQVASNETLDFRVERHEEQQVESSGELEFF
ncbi:MAG: hypothetical protein JSR83_24005 [Proteobacteria bacterium]|nr:hypothetical protein [Pseudomonadota bacterium]